MSIRVILADDHQIVREGLRLILGQIPEVEVVSEADTGRTAVELAKQLSPDVVVMDIGMPDLNGMEATRQILAHNPKVKVIGLSTYSDKRYVRGMLEAGAYAYVVKVAAGEELIRAIRAANRNKKYLSPDIIDTVVDGYLSKMSQSYESAGPILGAREREVLQLVAEGKSSGEIAAHLHISTRTVEAHRQNIMKKLGLHSVAELTKYAVHEGLTSPHP